MNSKHSVIQRRPSRHAAQGRTPARGFTLIELMIAMLLGWVVISGVTSIFIANQRAYKTNEALSDVQEGSRIGFEMLARDVRGAGLTGCDSTSGRVSNVLNGGSTNWYADWANALHGYDNSDTDPAVTTGTGAGQRVTGTDSLHIVSAGSLDATIGVNSGNNPARLFLNQASPTLAKGDIIMVCDYDHAAIVQISQYNGDITVVHNTGNGGGEPQPGNCSKGLGYPSDCSTNGNAYTFPPNSQIAKLSASDWYIGNNPVGGRSLYRITLVNNAGNMTTQADEMVRNVNDMQIQYIQPSNTYPVSAASVTDWSAVDATQITLTVQSTDKRAGTDAKPISRPFTFLATVRNRVQ
jgi:type IV pilus assembly protein PilW